MMKKIGICLLAGCLLTLPALAQDLLAFRNNKGFWGFKDKQGKVVIEPAYVIKPTAFAEGRSITGRAYNQKGAIDEKGKVIIEPKYNTLSEFKNGFAVATLQIVDTVNKKYGQPNRYTASGIFDRDGREIIPVRYRNLTGDFSNGWFVVADTGSTKKFYINTKGESFEPPAGIVLVPDNLDGKKFIAHKSYRYGIVDKNFKELLPFEYTSIRYSGHPGLLIVKKGNLSGLMDYNLKWVLPPTYPGISNFENGYACFSDTSKLWGAINTKGKVTTTPQFESISRIAKTTSSLAVFKRPRNDNAGLVDLATGKIVVSNNYTFGSFNYTYGLISFKQDGRQGLMDSTGHIIFHGKYDDFVTGMLNERAWVIKDKKYGFMDAKGQEIVPPQYESVLGFSEGLAAVKSGGLWGYINKEGTLVIPHQYKEVASFEGGVARVKDADNKLFYITPDGKIDN